MAKWTFRRKARLFWRLKLYRYDRSEWVALTVAWLFTWLGAWIILGVWGTDHPNPACCGIGIVTGPVVMHGYIWYLHLEDCHLDRVSTMIRLWKLIRDRELNPLEILTPAEWSHLQEAINEPFEEPTGWTPAGNAVNDAHLDRFLEVLVMLEKRQHRPRSNLDSIDSPQ